MNEKIIAIIPSRYQSSRFPGKPLAMICQKPMIQWVYERVKLVDDISDVYVATDDKRIFDCVIEFGGKAIMTGECSCGSDRVYQASADLDADIIVNIQGDEPLIKPEMIQELIGAFHDPAVEMATLKKRIVNRDEINNPNVVKVITDVKGDAIYFSRSTIPFDRDRKSEVEYYGHVGVYAYTKSFLKMYVNLQQGSLECIENLEQLRVLENGYKIRVIETEYQSLGVDVPDQILQIEEELRRKGNVYSNNN